MYKYEDEKPGIFTEEGQRKFLRVRDKVNKLLDTAGACVMWRVSHGLGGFEWEIMACVDRMVELGEIREIPTGAEAQDRVFVKRD